MAREEENVAEHTLASRVADQEGPCSSHFLGQRSRVVVLEYDRDNLEKEKETGKDLRDRNICEPP